MSQLGYERCWICKQWTRKDLMDLNMEIAGEKGRLCVACAEALRERDKALEQKRRMKDASTQTSQQPPPDKPSLGQGASGATSADTITEGTIVKPMDKGGDPGEGLNMDPNARPRCSQKECEKLAHWEYEWPTVGTMYACDLCQLKAGSVATALGLRIAFKLL